MSALNLNHHTMIHKIPTVLIVDDDIDVIINIERTLTRMGCNTLSALSMAEAQKKLLAGKIDFVILDWCLDKGLLANQLIEKVTKTFKKYLPENSESQSARRKTVFVTHSSLQEHELTAVPNDFFQYLEHWQKPIQRNDLVKKTMDVLKIIGF